MTLATAALLPSQSAANSKYAGIVVDHNTGRVLYKDNADKARFPASLTKVMTLYIAFEELEAGRLSYDTRMKVSSYAASRPPSKIYVKPGGTLRVKDAIGALVTKSANDASVVLAEHIEGSEKAFARRMTRTARALGMKRTTFRNANGLPNAQQVTTARDMATLGRAIQDRFPEKFKWFQTRRYQIGSNAYGNHNRLLGTVSGVDGIKTGYIRASGFNLLTSVNRDGRRVVAVVMGGRTSRSRNAHMADLIKRYFHKAKRGKRTAPLVASRRTPSFATAYAAPQAGLRAGNAPKPVARPAQVAAASLANGVLPPKAPGETAGAAASASQPVSPQIQAAESNRPLPLPTFRPEQESPIQLASAAAALPLAVPSAPVRPTKAAPEVVLPEGALPEAALPAVALNETSSPAAPPASRIDIAMAVAAEGSARKALAELPTANIETMPVNRAIEGPLPQTGPATHTTPRQVAALVVQPATPAVLTAIADTPSNPARAARAIAKPVVAQVATNKLDSNPSSDPIAKPDRAIQNSAPARAGWVIQIGAMPNRAEAEGLLQRAISKGPSAIAQATPFIEQAVVKQKTYHRARFSGFGGKSEAQQACRSLEKKEFACFATRS